MNDFGAQGFIERLPYAPTECHWQEGKLAQLDGDLY
jgi:hypothetical protein